MPYAPAEARYQSMPYRRTGKSGLLLPAISLGLWHNFGGVDQLESARKMLLRAFDLGITHFDLANNYGPPPGSAETSLGQLLKSDLAPHRDELVISTKAGYDHIVRSGKALYVGISNYPAPLAKRAAELLRALGTPCLIHQPAYNMFNRWAEAELMSVLSEQGMGCIAFSPLAQGLLTNKYLAGIPADSRAGKPSGFLRPEHVTEEKLGRVRALGTIAQARGQTLPQLAIAWVLRHPGMTSALIGASRIEQIEDAVGALQRLDFSADELSRIDDVLR